jgi:hypothetical protein
MKPFLTPAQRTKAVYDFAAGCYNQTTKIKDYKLLTQIMNDKTSNLQPIIILERTGTQQYMDDSISFNKQVSYRRNGQYSDDDSRKYVDYLIQVVFGSIPEKEERIAQANEQLFYIIGVLRDCIDKDNCTAYIMENRWRDDFEKYEYRLKEQREDFERKLDNQSHDFKQIDELKESIDGFEEQLHKQQLEVEQMNERIMDVLEKIRNWQKLYEPCLKEQIQQYNEHKKRIDNVLKGKQGKS